MAQTQFSEALEAANAHPRTSDVIDATKTAVIHELNLLDPSAEIRSTDYFNHSFAPDLVMSWKMGGRKKEERPIFLRGSIETAIVGQDLTLLSHEDPVILSLNQRSATAVFEENVALRKRANKQVRSSPHGLLTDATAMELMSRAEDSVVAPLEELVRRSFVREARGVVDAARVETLLPVVTPSADDEGFEAYDLAISATFDEGTSNRIRRTAQIVSLSQTGNLAALDSLSQEDGLSLTDPEIQALLPWLLKQDEFETAPEFWSWIGSQLSLSQFERQSQAFANLDISPLVRATSRTWVGKRSALVLAATEPEVEVSDEEPKEAAEELGQGDATTVRLSSAETLVGENTTVSAFEPADYVWHVSSGMPSVRIGDMRIFVSSDQRRLTGRDSRSAARWIDVLPAFRKMTMRGVQLDGLSRSLNASADTSENVIEDAQSVIDTIQDSFIVPFAVIADASDSTKDVTVDFGRLVASADNGASVATLTEAALRLLGYRILSPESVERTLGFDPSDASADSSARTASEGAASA